MCQKSTDEGLKPAQKNLLFQCFSEDQRSIRENGHGNMQKQGFLPLPGVSSAFDIHDHNEMRKADALDEFFRMAG